MSLLAIAQIGPRARWAGMQRMRDSEFGMLINLKFRGNRTSLCLDFSTKGMMNNRIERTLTLSTAPRTTARVAECSKDLGE